MYNGVKTDLKSFKYECISAVILYGSKIHLGHMSNQ
jgi:hypothetical protein